MKFRSTILVAGMLLGGLMVSMSSTTAMADIKTVPYVDVAKYLGDWYQIAHIPLVFEGGACSCARQRLACRKLGKTW